MQVEVKEAQPRVRKGERSEERSVGRMTTWTLRASWRNRKNVQGIPSRREGREEKRRADEGKKVEERKAEGDTEEAEEAMEW